MWRVQKLTMFRIFRVHLLICRRWFGHQIQPTTAKSCIC